MGNDALFAIRLLRSHPRFSAAVVLVLALGIGANSTVFGLVDALLLRPSPFAEPQRLVRIEERTSGNAAGTSLRDYEVWISRAGVFESTAALLRDTVVLTGDAGPEQVIAVRAFNLFPVLGVYAQSGRSLNASDDPPGAPPVAVISDRLWRRRYHSDPAVIGRGITVSEEPYTVVGVMPADFEFRYPEAELWTPLRLSAVMPSVQVAARLRPGISLGQAQSALNILARRMERERTADRAGFSLVVTQWRDAPEEKYRLTLVSLLAAAGIMMLIVCANVGGLLLTRTIQRQKEITIRRSLGAAPSRIARQLLLESFVLVVCGSLGGVLIARWLLRLLTNQLSALPIVLPHLQRVTLSERVLIFNALLSLLAAFLCSLAPTFLSMRIDLQSVLRTGPASSGGRESSRLFSILIALEAGLACLLLIGSGLMLRSFARLQQEDHGFRPDHVLTLRVPVGTLTQPRPTGKYGTAPQQMAYYREILEKVKRVRGIKAAAIVNNPPLSDISTSLSFGFRSSDGNPQPTSARTISPDYFAVMGIPLIAGRSFNEHDGKDAPQVAIINQSLARQIFPNENPLGRKLMGPSDSSGPTVVGLVKDSAQRSYELPAAPEVYIPYQQYIFAPFMSTLVVRTEGEPKALAAELRKQVWAIDPDQPVTKVETFQESIEHSVWRPRFATWIFSVLSTVVLLLTAMGMFGVVAYTSALRTREIGIRLALGATPSNVGLVLLEGAMIPLACGLAVGALTATVLSRLLSSLLYGIHNTDSVSYLTATAVLLLTGVAAGVGPAWRAATRDPLPMIRAE